jgi:hypothetical protein
VDVAAAFAAAGQQQQFRREEVFLLANCSAMVSRELSMLSSESSAVKPGP